VICPEKSFGAIRLKTRNRIRLMSSFSLDSPTRLPYNPQARLYRDNIKAGDSPQQTGGIFQEIGS
jgi:hypothetical protein